MSLDISSKVKPGVRPYNESGLHCPFDRQPVKKVCHKCELWKPLRLLVNGQEEEVWQCTFNWQASLALKQVVATECVEGEVHRLNDQQAASKANMAAFLGEVAANSNLIEGGKLKEITHAD